MDHSLVYLNETMSHAMLSSVQSLSCLTFFDPMDCSTPGSLFITKSWILLKVMYIMAEMPSNHLILCCPLLLLPSIFPRIRVFSNKSAVCIRWPKDWSLSFSISPSNGYSGLISFRLHCWDLLAVQGTLKGLLQHQSSKPSVLRRSFLEVKDGKMALGNGDAHRHPQH